MNPQSCTQALFWFAITLSLWQPLVSASAQTESGDEHRPNIVWIISEDNSQ